MGMVRIFMSPKNDERGSPMLFRDQRLMMIEMDKFIVSRKLTFFSLASLAILKICSHRSNSGHITSI